MSMRTVESNKAIASAWEKERQLVLEGKGTRDWTPEQQQDILDKDKGKAYDDDGRAFQGHHMKSAEKHPECQGEPGNIQFLSRSEHLTAHGGSWSNLTNGYFNPTTGETIGFGLDEFKPCEIIELTNPIDVIRERKAQNAAEVDKSKASALEAKEAKPVELNDLIATNTQREFVRLEDILPASQAAKNGGSLRSMPTQQTKGGSLRSAVKRTFSSAGKFFIQHQSIIKPIAELVISVGVPLALDAMAKPPARVRTKPHPTIPLDTTKQSTPNQQTLDRSPPSPNTVPPHKQRYHTKNGVEWREKAQYPRGGKN